MDNKQKEKLSKKYIEGLYGIWRPKKKLPLWHGLLFFYFLNDWFMALVWMPRRSYYLFGSFEVKDPGVKFPYEMTDGEKDFYLRCKAYERACKIRKIYARKPWEELCTPRVFLREAKNQWRFVWSHNACRHTRIFYFFNLLLFVIYYLCLTLTPPAVLIVLLYFLFTL